MILINGDIYIKIKPSKFNPTKEEIQKIENRKYNIDFLEADKGITPKTEQMRKLLNNIENMIKNNIGEPD